MRETIELRIPEEPARLVLDPSEGTMLGDSVRKLVLDATDERLSDIRRADEAMRGQAERSSLHGTCAVSIAVRS